MRVLMIAMVSLSLGLALTLLPVAGLWIVAAVLLLLGTVFFLFFRKRELRLTLVFLVAGVGMAWGLGYQSHVAAPALQYAGTTVEIWAQVVSYSQPTDYGVQTQVLLELPEGNFRATVWLSVQEELIPGDRVFCRLRLKDSSNAGSYYSYSEGIYLLGYSSGEVTVRKTGHIPLKYYPKVLAHRLEENLENAMDGDTLGYAMALTTGNRREMTEISKANLKLSGIYHALALSGMHMVVLVGFINLLVWKRRRLRAIVGIPACLIFLVITGGSPSLVRAAVMQCLCLLADLFDREGDWPTSLSLALGLLMLENPWCVFNWGLQLSFLSVIGIELFGEKIRAFLTGAKKEKNSILRWLRSTLASSLGATGGAMVMTMPLMALYFGFVSVISLVTNLLTGQIISVCFGGSLLTALVGLISPVFGRGLGWVLGWGFHYVDWVAGLMARVPFGQVYTDSFYGAGLVISLYLMILLLMKSKRKIIPLCCGGTLFGVCMFLVLLEGLAPSVTALDVGQGQCVVLRNGGSTMMVDCGGNQGNSGDIGADYLSSMGVSSLDLLVLTHFDDDHVNGVSQLLERITVEALVVPESEERELLALASEKGIPVYVIRQDTLVSFGGDPVTIFAPISSGNDNDAGLSVLADFEDFEVLVTGDMSETAEMMLLAKKEIPAVDVLLAGHHGAEDSTSEALLQATAPRYVIISVGENQYGHPTEAVLRRIQAQGAILRRTDQHGNVTIKGR